MKHDRFPGISMSKIITPINHIITKQHSIINQTHSPVSHYCKQTLHNSSSISLTNRNIRHKGFKVPPNKRSNDTSALATNPICDRGPIGTLKPVCVQRTTFLRTKLKYTSWKRGLIKCDHDEQRHRAHLVLYLSDKNGPSPAGTRGPGWPFRQRNWNTCRWSEGWLNAKMDAASVFETGSSPAGTVRLMRVHRMTSKHARWK